MLSFRIFILQVDAEPPLERRRQLVPLPDERASLQLLEVALVLLVALSGAVGRVHGHRQPVAVCQHVRHTPVEVLVFRRLAAGVVRRGLRPAAQTGAIARLALGLKYCKTKAR